MKTLKLVLVLLVGVMLFLGKGYHSYRQEVRELQARLALAEEQVVVKYVHDSIPVYETKVVEVDRTDYKQLLADKELIKELGLKINALESENRTLLSTRDTVVLEPVVGDSILEYSDKWSSFSYDSASRVLNWEIRDSLSAFVSREYRHRFLWWRWGVKGYKVDIVSHNPHCVVEYNQYIKIK